MLSQCTPIASCSFSQASVHKAVQIRFPEIALHDYAQPFSDGFRPDIDRARAPTWEAKITHLFEMGLATRNRAIQVLESVNGNLNDAVNLLFAANAAQE
jgi:hypothetical protein